MMISEGDRKVILSSLMWSAGKHFAMADFFAKQGQLNDATEKASFAIECHRLVPMFQPGGKIDLFENDGIFIGAALAWAALEHEKDAQALTGSEQIRRRAFSSECARLAEQFRKPV